MEDPHDRPLSGYFTGGSSCSGFRPRAMRPISARGTQMSVAPPKAPAARPLSARPDAVRRPLSGRFDQTSRASTRAADSPAPTLRPFSAQTVSPAGFVRTPMPGAQSLPSRTSSPSRPCSSVAAPLESGGMMRVERLEGLTGRQRLTFSDAPSPTIRPSTAPTNGRQAAAGSQPWRKHGQQEYLPGSYNAVVRAGTAPVLMVANDAHRQARHAAESKSWLEAALPGAISAARTGTQSARSAAMPSQDDSHQWDEAIEEDLGYAHEEEADLLGDLVGDMARDLMVDARIQRPMRDAVRLGSHPDVNQLRRVAWKPEVWLKLRQEAVQDGKLDVLTAVNRLVRFSTDQAIERMWYELPAEAKPGVRSHGTCRVDLGSRACLMPKTTWYCKGQKDTPWTDSYDSSKEAASPGTVVCGSSVLDTTAVLQKDVSARSSPILIVADVNEFDATGDVCASLTSAVAPEDMLLRTDLGRFLEKIRHERKTQLEERSLRDCLQDRDKPFVIHCPEVTVFRGSHAEGYPFYKEPFKVHVVLWSMADPRPSIHKVRYRTRGKGKAEWYGDERDYNSLLERLELVAQVARTEALGPEGQLPGVVLGFPGCEAVVSQPFEAVASALKHWRHNFGSSFNSTHVCCRGRRCPDLKLTEKARKFINRSHPKSKPKELTKGEEDEKEDEGRRRMSAVLSDPSSDEEKGDAGQDVVQLQADKRLRQITHRSTRVGKRLAGGTAWTQDKMAKFMRERRMVHDDLQSFGKQLEVPDVFAVAAAIGICEEVAAAITIPIPEQKEDEASSSEGFKESCELDALEDKDSCELDALEDLSRQVTPGSGSDISSAISFGPVPTRRSSMPALFRRPVTSSSASSSTRRASPVYARRSSTSGNEQETVNKGIKGQGRYDDWESQMVKKVESMRKMAWTVRAVMNSSRKDGQWSDKKANARRNSSFTGLLGGGDTLVVASTSSIAIGRPHETGVDRQTKQNLGSDARLSVTTSFKPVYISEDLLALRAETKARLLKGTKSDVGAPAEDPRRRRLSVSFAGKRVQDEKRGSSDAAASPSSSFHIPPEPGTGITGSSADGNNYSNSSNNSNNNSSSNSNRNSNSNNNSNNNNNNNSSSNNNNNNDSNNSNNSTTAASNQATANQVSHVLISTENTALTGAGISLVGQKESDHIIGRKRKMIKLSFPSTEGSNKAQSLDHGNSPKMPGTNCQKAIQLWSEKNEGANPEEAAVVKLLCLSPPIEKMDSSLNQLVNVRHLALSTNCIDKMISLPALKNIEILSLGRNMIKKISGLEEIGATLRELWISYNSISDLGGLSACTKLTTLFISNNKIKAGKCERRSPFVAMASRGRSRSSVAGQTPTDAEQAVVPADGPVTPPIRFADDEDRELFYQRLGQVVVPQPTDNVDVASSRIAPTQGPVPQSDTQEIMSASGFRYSMPTSTGVPSPEDLRRAEED
ncbi:unnamed protein product [Polarella glacialis]|uniref:Dynein axonemal light chain 1 n=1 Tax=Polarella glacialis TaxID=89957 RepID=A0A813F668_POLGL|nr:unnamed protein product [Polarella glacialis]